MANQTRQLCHSSYLNEMKLCDTQNKILWISVKNPLKKYPIFHYIRG